MDTTQTRWLENSIPAGSETGESAVANTPGKGCRIALVCLCLYGLSLLVYLSNERTIGAVDTGPARHLALSLLRDFDLYLDECREIAASISLDAATREAKGHLVSNFPPGPAIAAAPFYWIGMKIGLRADGAGGLSRLEKWAAANLAAVAAVLFWLLLVRTNAPVVGRTAVWIAFAFGSPMWVPASQGLWQHAPLVATVIGALLALPGAGGGRRAGFQSCLAGFLLGIAVLMRPVALILVPAWALVLLVRNWRAAIWFVAGVAVGLIPYVVYQSVCFGSVTGGGYVRTAREFGLFSQFRPFLHLAGYMFSPSRGLLVFCPFFAILGLWAIPGVRRIAVRGLDVPIHVISALALFAVLIAYRIWWAGHSYGPRFLADLMPFLCALSLPPVEFCMSRPRLRWLTGGVVWALLTFGVIVQQLGALRYDGVWDLRVGVDQSPAALWSLSDNVMKFSLTGTDPTITQGDSEIYFLPEERWLNPGDPGMHPLLNSGFNEQESWGVWTRGVMPAELWFHTRGRGGALFLKMCGFGNVYAPVRIDCEINGRFPQRFELTKDCGVKWDPQEIPIRVPAEALTGGIERIVIKVLDPCTVSPTGRYYGVAVSGIKWIPE
jgi:hypothetical protein